MTAMRRLYLLLLLLPAAALAQPLPQVAGLPNTITVRPAEKVKVGCRWDRTMIAATATVRRIGVGAQADPNPNQIITDGPIAHENLVSIQLAPDNGCAAPGCRTGNQYQVDITGIDTSTNAPMCAVLLRVREQTF